VKHAEEDIRIDTAWGSLAGTLCLPEAGRPAPLVLLIAGSGPTDRDGNNPMLPQRFDTLRHLAASLAEQGLASFRYDKRGLGDSACPGLTEETLRFDQLVEDAVACCAFLRRDARLQADTPVLLGHSEGALIAALAASAVQARAVVSVAGAGERASTLMRRQIAGALPPDLLEAATAALDALDAGGLADDVPDDLVLLFRPSVQPYLVSWFRHDPAEVLAALEAPVLLVHGADDSQVPPEHAQRLHQRHPAARLCIVAGMDHLLAIEGDVAAGARRVARETAGWLQPAAQRQVA
jgi:pimeloyl-ACP methyl ester carboxylesterase